MPLLSQSLAPILLLLVGVEVYISIRLTQSKVYILQPAEKLFPGSAIYHVFKLFSCMAGQISSPQRPSHGAEGAGNKDHDLGMLHMEHILHRAASREMRMSRQSIQY